VAEAIRDERARVRSIAAILDSVSLDDGLPSAVLGSGSEESDNYSD